MKLNLDNFDEKSIKNLPQEPYITLHQLRDCINRGKALDELKKKIEAAEIEQSIDVVYADKEKVEQDFYSLLKKLVECASLDAVNITLTSIKDIFNAIAERLAQWRTIAKKDRERADLDPANLEGQEQLVILSQASALLSWQSPPNVEKVDNPSLLLEIIKESEDPRVIALSCKTLTNIGGGTHTRNFEIADKIAFLAIGQNLLRSPENHFTLKEILAGENKNGTKLLESDFLFEIEIAAQGLNDKSRIQTISIPRNEILKSELSAPQLVDQIINDHCRNMSDNAMFKAKLNARIIWFRFITHQKRLREATKAMINATKNAYNFKQENRHPEYIQYLKEPFMEQVVELMQHQPDKDLCLAMIQCCAAIYRQRQQEPQINDPFIRVPPPPQNQDNDQPDEEQQSFILRALKDISSCRLEEDGMNFKKSTDAKCLDQEIAKSSYYQYCCLRFFKSLIVSARMGANANANEIQQYIACMLKIVVDIPSSEGQYGLYRYNLKVACEALINLKTLVKPRVEEQHDLIKKLESRLVFEIQNLDKSINAINDGEEFNVEQEQVDRQSICRIILNILNDLVQRDRESIGMSRKIQESQILTLLNQVVQYNTPDKASLIEQFMPMYYALIGQICGDSPAVTPALIKNGVIPDILKASKDRLTETSESLYLFLFALYQISIHEEGKKYAEDLGVFQSVFTQIMESEKLQEFWAANYFVNIRQYVFNLFDRNAVYKTVASDIIKVAIEKADSLIDSFDTKYFDLISNRDLTREQINDIIAKEFKKSGQYKCLTTMVNIISLFSGSDDRAGERQINNRHAADIFTEEIFKKVVAIHEKAAQIPALIEISLIFAKVFRFLVDSNGIPANIIRFLDAINSSHQEFLAIMPKKLSKLDSFDFIEEIKEDKQPEQASNEDQKMEGVEEQERTSQLSWVEPRPSEPEQPAANENISSLEPVEEKIDTTMKAVPADKQIESTKTHLILRNFHKFVIYVKAFHGLHTATQQQMFQDPKTVALIQTILGVMRVLLKMKIQVKNAKYQQVLADSGSSTDEAKLKQLKALKLTQKEFNLLSLEERLDAGLYINLPLVQKRDSMLKEMIPGLGISVHCLDDLAFKFGDLTFQTIFRQLRDNQGRENNEKNLIHMGRLAFNITKQIAHEKLESVVIDNSTESLRILLTICTNIEELNKFAAKGWTSGVCFYEFFRLGGLHNMIECFNWLGKQLSVINEEETLRTHYVIVDRCCQYIRDFFIKFVLEEDRLNVRDSRHSEVYQQTIIALKMEGFDNIKHFYQNVSNALLENLFKLKDDQPKQNVLAALNKQGLPHLLDVALSVLNCASKGFQSCVMLKMAGGNNDRHIENREGGNRRGVPPPPNPQNVQMLTDMMPQFDQERIIEALQQSRDNLERAFGLLEQWNAQGLYTSSLAKQNAVIQKQEGAKEDSDDESSEKKLTIITEDQYKNSLKLTQQRGLQWILDSIDIIDQNRSQSFILEAMRDKNMAAEAKQLNEKIESLLASAFIKLTDLLQTNFTKKEEDMIDTTAKQESKETETQLNKVSNLIRIIQRLIINQKEYFKLSIKSQTPLTALKNLSFLLNFVNDSKTFDGIIRDQKSILSNNFNKLLQEYMMLLFSFAQLAHLNAQMLSQARVGHSDSIAKQKIEYLRKQIPSTQILEVATKIMTLSGQGALKPTLLSSSILLSLRIIIDKESVDKTQRETAIKTLFDKLIEISNSKNFKLDNKIISSIAILYFENDQLIHSQIEKFVQRALFSKYEYEVSQKKESPTKKEENGYELSKHSLNNFLTFFSQLSYKNQELFKKSLNEQCSIKGTKKAGANLSVDQSTIMLKEVVFNEAKKAIVKERALWKQLTKVVDIKNDKQMKQQMKASKKALIQSVPENSLQALQTLLQQAMESNRIQIESFNTYYSFHSEQKPYIISEEEQNAFPYDSLQNSLDIISKLCLAYPAYSVAFLPQKQPGVVTKKLNFFQWYIREYLMMDMLSRSATSIKKGEESQQQFEVSYVVKSDIKLVESQVARFLNKLTGYNSLMTLNEQLIKHQLRNRFMLEAMNNLQKTIKEKGGNPLKQRCLLLASLTVIEALINNQTPSAKVPSISGDNFLNSMRACFIRDASCKEQNLPNSFLKILDELITDYIDVSLPSNSDIVSKCINILKIIATFVHGEKKKEEAKAALSDEEVKEGEERKDQPADQVMQEPDAQSSSEEDSAIDDEEEEEDPDGVGFDPLPLIHMPNPPVHDDDDEDEEDDAMEEDEGEDEDEEGVMEDLPLGQEEIDDYDEEDDGDDDEFGDGMIVANRQDRRGPQLDIINPRQAAPANARPWGHGIDPFGGAVLGRRNEARLNNNPDWTEEEDNVQRILNNLRANNVQAAAEPQRPGGYQQYGLDRRGMWAPPGQRDVQEQQADINLKKGLIEQTFEEFKVISEKELYEMMLSQRAALDTLSASAQLPKPPRPLAGNILGIEREYGNLFAPLGRVDEIDDMDIVRNPVADLQFYEQIMRLQDQAIALNQDLGGIPPALFGGIRDRELFGGNWRGALHVGHPGAAPIQQPDLQQYDAGLFNQQLRQQQPGLGLDQLGQQLLQSMEVQVEEIKEQQPPPSSSTSAAQPQLNIPPIPHQPLGGFPNPFADLRQAVIGGAGRQGALPDDDSLLQAFFNQAPSNVAPPNAPQSPQVQNAQPNVPASEADEIRRRMDEQSRQLRDQISAQQESIQRIVEMQSSVQQMQVGSPRLIAAPAQPQPLEHLEPALADQPIPVASSESLEQPIQAAENVEQEPAQMEQNEPVIAQEEISAFEEAPENIVAPIQEVSQQLEQVRLPNEEEKVSEQPVAAEETKQPVNADSGFTFGYDNNVLLENGIDPAILAELPEELRAELLSTIDIQPVGQQQQQVPSQQVQQNPSSLQVQEEEKKEDANALQPAAQAQPEAAQQQQQPAESLPEYVAIAVELGLDPEFLANLPEDMRMELIQNAQLEQRPPQRQPEQMDLASFVATVTDQNLRREIFMNMDEATIASLPPNLMAEARQVHDYVRNRQRQQRDLLQNPIDRARGIIDQALHGMNDDRDHMAELFGRRYRGEQDRRGEPARREKTLEECVNLRQKQLSDEAPKDDLLQQLPIQINNDEKILEALILILLTNDKIECGLIPCLQILTKIQSSNGVPVIRNKVINALVFILKLLSTHDQDAMKTMFPNHQLKEKQSALLVIGTIRLLLKTNRGLMKFILRGIVAKDENQTGKNVSTHMLRKQLKALTLKSSSEIQTTTVASEEAHSSIDTSSIQAKDTTSSKSKPAITPPSPLTEIFSLIKSELFKQDKSLMKNLSLLIQQILKQFSIAREELELGNQQISQETISSIAEVLSLDIIDENLMEDLGDFFFSISQKKQQNFKLICQYCTEKSSKLLSKLQDKLADFTSTFDDIKRRVQPGLGLGIIESRQLSSNSALEEEKGDVMMIDTQLHDNAKGSKSSGMKLQEEDERRLKQLLKVHEDSEILLRIFKLFNIFYMKFSELEKQKQEEGEAIESSSQQPKEVQEFVKKSYESGPVAEFVDRVSEVLKVVFRVNLDVSEGLSNLIFCVFASFYPELLESIRVEEEEQKEQEKKRSKDSGKYLVRMLPLSEATVKGASKEKTSVFRNAFYMTLRTEDFSRFCMANKRLINKMIKQRPSMFVKELEQMIKYMPNLLDFENKRTYFKKELAKLKRNQYHDQIQLFIRRDDIFMDAYAQINQRSADEMKGRMHIQFTGERGQDAGGLTRDFFIELSREMFNPSYSLFILSSSGSTYYPNPKSYVERDHLRYFKFIGRILGKALFDECLLECYFVKSLYKIMAGEALSFADIEDFDNEFYTNLKWCLENDVSCLMTTFVVEQDFFGKAEEIELVEGGKTIQVTNENKHSYVENLTYFKLYKCIQKQVDSFLEGFYELIPKDLVSIFNFKELELLISGLPNFDLDDLKANTEYSGYQPTSPQVQWLWEVLESLENSERAEFLQFVTGSSKVPIDGFKGLMGMRGPQKFTIAKIKTDDIMRLPSGHTCFNQLDLPEYPSKEILHERLLIAIKETKGFGFA